MTYPTTAGDWGTLGAGLVVPADLSSMGPPATRGGSNLTLSGEQNVGGVYATDGMPVMLRAQTDLRENGPWSVSTGAWNRPPGFENGDTFATTSVAAGLLASDLRAYLKAYVLIVGGAVGSGAVLVIDAPMVGGGGTAYVIPTIASETTVTSGTVTAWSSGLVTAGDMTADFTFSGGKFTVVTGGYYRFSGVVTMQDDGSATALQVFCDVNSGAQQVPVAFNLAPNTGGGLLATSLDLVYLATPGDVLEPQYYTDSGAPTQLDVLQMAITRGI